MMLADLVRSLGLVRVRKIEYMLKTSLCEDLFGQNLLRLGAGIPLRQEQAKKVNAANSICQ